MVGAGIFVLPTAIAAYGSIGLLGWGVTALGALCLALVFASLSKRYPQTGGPYAYSREAFGDFIGFQMAWSYWLSIVVSNSAVTIAFVGFVASFIPAFSGSPLLQLSLALGTFWGLTVLNSMSVRTVGNLQVLTTALKILPLIVLSVVGIFYVKWDHFSPFILGEVSWFDGLSAAAALTLFGFMGLESATIPAERIKNPARTIPRATILGTILTALVYVWVTTIVVGLLGVEKTAEDPAAFATASGIALGDWAIPVIAIAAAISSFGGLNGWILLQGQIPMAAARDGLFPKVFMKTSSKGIPVLGLIVSGVFVSFLLLMNYEAGLAEQLRFVVNLTAFAVLLPYLYSSAAEILFLLKNKKIKPGLSYVRPLFISILALVYSFGALFGSGQDIVYFGLFLVLGGIPIYLWLKSQKMS
tara:strand:- start:2297 stop:3544 length:1248 start_codon:yes stop_codon:yes gene_type:complete